MTLFFTDFRPLLHLICPVTSKSCLLNVGEIDLLQASRLNVVYQREDDAGFRLDIPEFDHIGNNFDLGVFNFVGSKL
jgi:hypothetical protein